MQHCSKAYASAEEKESAGESQGIDDAREPFEHNDPNADFNALGSRDRRACAAALNNLPERLARPKNKEGQVLRPGLRDCTGLGGFGADQRVLTLQLLSWQQPSRLWWLFSQQQLHLR